MTAQTQASETCLIVNPAAGRGRAGRLGPRIARELSLENEQVAESSAPGNVQQLVKSFVNKGYIKVAVAGGDGTIFEAINGLVQAGRVAALGIVPVGTGNDFIKAAGIPLAWRDACELVRSGRMRSVDIGRCNELYFANGVGIGLDAEIGHTAQGISWFRGPMVYLAAAFRTLAGGISAPEVSIAFDDGELVQRVTLVAVSNGSCFGGLFHIAPDASISDGSLDLVIADHVTRVKALRLIPRVIRGEHLHDPAVRYLQTRKVKIHSDRALPVQIDGELIEGGLTDLDIEVLASRIRLLC
ncbi:MAG: diacylglycerol kinase family lipid kinase [Gammaproteobacteria bacterium]|nr:diacylglycerol kinase family lipid kinase [Gammaproteobacteria bacterium]